MKKLSELSLADLVSLYNNYMITRLTPTRDLQQENRVNSWVILTPKQFKDVDKEIKTRISNINFKEE